MKRRWRSTSQLPLGWLVFIAGPTLADLPYNPTTVLVPPQQGDPIAYVFSPDSTSSQFQFSYLPLSTRFDISSDPFKLSQSTLPFLSPTSLRPFIPIPGPRNNITILVGDCTGGAAKSEIWEYSPDKDAKGFPNGTWTKLDLSIASGDNTASLPTEGVNFLARGFSFSPTSPADVSFYSFGGMCPAASTSSGSWTSAATYSSTVTEISTSSSESHKFSLFTTTTTRAAPVPEAGLTITPLAPTFGNSSDANPSQNQNFVLLGGHTQSAFINMSQVALFSLPEASWTFLSIDPATPAPQGDLTRDTDDSDVEPRSGHSAVLTPDGTRIILFGGWVGDVNTPATPQLAILEVGAGYGGSGDWRWTIPSIKTPVTDNGGGLYGHGAAMLPDGVMLITGGYSIPGSPSSRLRRDQGSSQTQSTKSLLFNTTSLAFISEYTPTSGSHSPSTTPSSSGALHSTSQKVGLGTGLGLGFSALASLLLIYLWYSRRTRRRRHQRDSEIRELALGAQRYYHNEDDERPPLPTEEDSVQQWNEKLQPSHSIKRKPVPATSYLPWNQLPPNQRRQQQQEQQQEHQMTGARDAERTGLLVEIPSPTRGLRRSLHSRPYNYTPGFAQGMHQPAPFAYGPSHGSTRGSIGGIHPIEEQEEQDWDAEGKSIKSRKSARSVVDENNRGKNAPAAAAEKSQRWSDPFKDPPPQILEPAGPVTISVPIAVPQSEGAAATTTADDEALLGRTQSQERRDRDAEIAGWVDDWNAAAANLNMEVVRRAGSAASQARNHGVSRSASHTHSHSASDRRSGTMTSSSGATTTPALTVSGRGSPEKDKSDGRTNSTLSEMSVASSRSYGSLQRSNVGTIRREESQRSVSAGAASAAGAAASAAGNLFAGAAAAMVAGVAGGRRSSVGVGAKVDFRDLPGASGGGGGDHRPWEKEGLLSRADTDHTLYATPPESPIKENNKDRSNSLSNRAVGFLGSVKKALVGSGAVKRRVEEYEEKEVGARGSGYWERENESLMQGGRPGQGLQRATSAGAAFWRGRKGRADWEDDPDLESPTKSSKSEGARLVGGGEEDVSGRRGSGEDGDWDVEDAVQRRVVQVMFTVPKEKLRVVNVDPDGLSVVSDGRESRLERERGAEDGEGGGGGGQGDGEDGRARDRGKGKERLAE